MNRLKSLTIIHNYYLKRSDGTTAAERLFRRKFDDPFEWLVAHLTELPLARTVKQGGAVTCWFVLLSRLVSVAQMFDKNYLP